MKYFSEWNDKKIGIKNEGNRSNVFREVNSSGVLFRHL